jgi:HPt (histidine-containing phosphotransfer) domain-containing protein
MSAARLLYLTAPGRPVELVSPYPGDPWDVEAVTSADQARSALARRPVDACLIDGDVATAAGPDAWRQLVASAGDRHVPVIVVGQGGAPPGARSAPPGELAALVEQARIDRQLEELHELGGPEFVAEMVGLLCGQVPEQLRQMRDALAAGDLEATRRAAHSLKSSAGSFGARTVEEIARLIEQRAGEGDAAAVATLVPQLGEGFRRVQLYLRAQADRATTTGRTG